MTAKIARFRPLFAPIAVIAAGIALAAFFWWIGQPRGHQPHTGPVITRPAGYVPPPTATPIYVTTLPGAERHAAENPAVIRCTLTPGQTYETRRVLFMDNGGKYALIRTDGGCNGWTWIGY